MFFFCRLMDGCLNRGPYTRIFGGGGGGKLATSTCLENCSARNPDTGNECLCFLGGEGGGEGREAVPVMEWYPIQG